MAKNTSLMNINLLKSKHRILVGVNVLTQLDSQVVASHEQFWYRLGRQHTKYDFLFYSPRRCSIDRMRNTAAKAALEAGCEFLMFIDDDVIIDGANTLDSMLRAMNDGADIVMAETYIRGYPFEPMFFTRTKNNSLTPYRDFKKHVSPDGFLKKNIEAVGFSCVLIRCSMLKKVTTPYFVTGPNSTEDVYFCLKAKEQLGDKNVKIYVDTNVPTGHLLDPEPIHARNREALIKYYETVYPWVKEETERKSVDRSNEYAAAVIEAIKEKRAKVEPGLRKRKDSKLH